MLLGRNQAAPIRGPRVNRDDSQGLVRCDRDDRRAWLDDPRHAFFTDPIYGAQRRAEAQREQVERDTAYWDDNPFAERDRRDRARLEALRNPPAG